jgi:predicted aconitase with swiveling domain
MNMRWMKKFIKEAREVRLAAQDKRAMLSRILGPSSIPSPYSFFLAVMEHRQKILVASFMFVFLLTSGGTSFAATGALPGEALYPIKVNINEGLQSLVAVSPNAKAKIEVRHTQNRLVEAEVLSKKGKLDEKTKAIIETKLEEHAEALKGNIATLASENATATVKEVISDLSASIEEHEAVLTDLATSTEIDAVITKANKVKTEMEDIGKKVDEDQKDKEDEKKEEEEVKKDEEKEEQATTTASTSVSVTEPVILITWTSSSSVSQEILPNASSSQQ